MVSAWLRFGYGLFATVSLMLGGLVYNRVFVDALLPEVPESGTFVGPVYLLESLVPLIFGGLLLFTWLWVIAGAVQDERSIEERRYRTR